MSKELKKQTKAGGATMKEELRKKFVEVAAQLTADIIGERYMTEFDVDDLDELFFGWIEQTVEEGKYTAENNGHWISAEVVAKNEDAALLYVESSLFIDWTGDEDLYKYLIVVNGRPYFDFFPFWKTFEIKDGEEIHYFALQFKEGNALRNHWRNVIILPTDMVDEDPGIIEDEISQGSQLVRTQVLEQSIEGDVATVKVKLTIWVRPYDPTAKPAKTEKVVTVIGPATRDLEKEMWDEGTKLFLDKIAQ